MFDIHALPNISIIVAIAQNNAIGKDNDLIWHISDDLKRFKALTSGHTVIMGRNTWNSLPRRPLPKRRNIVLTHDVTFAEEGAEVAHSLQQVLDMVRGGCPHRQPVRPGAPVPPALLAQVSRAP